MANDATLVIFTAQQIVDFLRRDDVLVGLGKPSHVHRGQIMLAGVVVHHKFWEWEGRAENVIDAAVLAMRAECEQGG